MKINSLILASVLSCSAVWAADEAPVNPVTEVGAVKILWQNPTDFRDIESSGEIQSRYQQRLFETLTENIDKEAGKILSPNQKLEMTVTDLDLAGDARPTFGATSDDLRIVKEVYPPRIAFNYKVIEGGKVIVAGDEKLADLGFMDGIRPIGDRPFQYESDMIATWLKRTLAPKL